MLVVIADILCEIGRETRYTWCSCETGWHAGARSQVSRRSSAPILSRRLFVNTIYSRNLVRLHCYMYHGRLYASHYNVVSFVTFRGV